MEIVTSPIAYLRAHLDSSRATLERMVADLSTEQLHWIPPGTAHPISERYAHLVVSEDTLVNGVARGGSPLHATEWSGRTGLSDVNVMLADLGRARALRVNAEELHRYAAAVARATDAYLASLNESDLERTVDLSAFGQGTYALGTFLQTFVLSHLDNIVGEISVLRGLQGLRGYPF